MVEPQWENKLKAFMKKAGEDFKRAGNDIKDEAQRLYQEVQDPETQAKLRERLKEVGAWAKQTGDELAVLLDQGAKKAEGVITKAADKVKDFATQPPPGTRSPGTGAPPPSEPPKTEAAPAAPKGPAKKTVGRSGKKPAAKKKASAKKPLGKSGPADDESDPDKTVT